MAAFGTQVTVAQQLFLVLPATCMVCADGAGMSCSLSGGPLSLLRTVEVTLGHKAAVKMVRAQCCRHWQSSTWWLLECLHFQTVLWKSVPRTGIRVPLHGQVSRPETKQGEQELPRREKESKRDMAGRAEKTNRRQGDNAEGSDRNQCLQFPECLELTASPVQTSSLG